MKSPTALKSSATFSDFKADMEEIEIVNYLPHRPSDSFYPNIPTVKFTLTTSRGSLKDEENIEPAAINGRECFEQ